MKKEKKDVELKMIGVYGKYSLVLVGIFALILVSFMFVRVEADAEFTCNSGFIGLDFEAYNTIQNKTCEYDANYTCFKDDLLLKHLKIKDIEGLTCYGKGKAKMPLLLSMFMN